MATQASDTSPTRSRVRLAAVRGILRGRTRPARCPACGLPLRASEARARVGGAELHVACARGPDPDLAA